MTWPAVVFVEEDSARIVVEELSRRLGFSERVKVIPHEGKSDLERSFPRKMRGWRSPLPRRFLVARDGAATARDQLKSRLMALVPEQDRDRTKVRIVVHELESWFLGDPQALEKAGVLTTSNARTRAMKLAARNLCVLSNPVQLLHGMTSSSGKLGLARAIAPHLSLTDNHAPSFPAFIAALRWVAEPA